ASPIPGGDIELLLKLENVTVVQNDEVLLENVSLRLGVSQSLAVTGPNGAGKTTLLRVVLGEIYPVYGATVERFGTSSTNQSEWRQYIGYVTPNLHAAWY